MYPVQQQRPAGVSVLAILSFVGGALWIIGGFVIAAVFSSLLGVGGIGSFLVLCSGIFIVIGLIEFFVGYGLWTLQGWAWTLGIIFAIIGLINVPIGTIISIIVLWYLFRPEIKAVFGKGPAPMYPPPYAYPPYGPPGAPPYQPPPQPSAPYGVPSPPPQQPPTWGPPSQPPATSLTCKNCGAPLQAGAKFCVACGTKVA